MDYTCILQFDDQSPSFTYGFQAGQIWQLTKTNEPFDFQFCGEILELVQRMPPRCNYTFKIDSLDDDWYNLQAVPF